MNRMAEGYCDGLALNDVEDPARYRQAAEQGGLLALHDEMSAATTAERGPSRRLLDSVVTRLRMGWGDLFDRAGVIADLNVYEGQSHAQYQMNIDAPETKEAFTDIAKFFDRYLKQ